MKRKILALALAALVVLCSLSVGISASAAAATVVGGTVAEVTAAPGGTNHLKGLTPTQGVTDAPMPITAGTGDWSHVTDGLLPVITDGETRSVSVTSATGGEDAYTQVTFTMKNKVAVSQILLGNSKEDSPDYRLRWGKIYITNSRASLYTEASLVLEFRDVAWQAAMFTLDTPVEGVYIGFSFWIPPHDPDSTWQTLPVDGVRYGRWWEQARIGELGVYGDITGTPDDEEDRSTVEVTGGSVTSIVSADQLPQNNLLAGCTPTMGDTSTAYTPYAGSMAALADGSVLGLNATADAASLAASSASLPTVNTPWNTSSNGWGAEVWLVYDLGANQSVDTLLIANALTGKLGTAPTSSRYVYSGELYVADTRAHAVTDTYRVLSFTSENGHRDTPAVMKFSLNTAAAGRYVGVHFTLPEEAVFSETGANDGSGNYRYKTARLSELGVYFENNPFEVTRLMSAADVSKLPASENLLKGKKVTAEDGSSIQFDAKNVEMSAFTPWENATDGVINNLTNTLAAITEDTQNRFSYRTYVEGGIAVDLRGQVEISEFLAAADSWDEPTYRINKVAFFASNTLKDLFDEPIATVNFNNALAVKVTLKEAVTARFVGFCIPSAGYMVRIGELGVYGTVKSEMGEVKNLIAFKTPSEEYQCEPNHPDIFNEPQYRLGDMSWATSSSALTDGDTETLGSWTHISSDRLVTWLERNYCHPNTPWGVVIYHLGGTASVETILLTSTGEWGEYYIGGADFYVGQTLTTLFDPKNRVMTTHGEKTTTAQTDEGEEVILDPSTDVKTRTIRCDLETPKEGRYMAVVVTRPTASTKLGYSISRVAELEVFGSLPADKVEQIPPSTFTDAATGCTMTVKQKNFDDIDFFKTIGSLKVTVTPVAKEVASTVNHWLSVDSDVYSFMLYDVNGNPLTAKELDGRKVTLTVPYTKDNDHGLGEIVDGKIRRVRNSRIVDGVILGNNIARYPTQVVVLGFDKSYVQTNGVAGSAAVQTAGVQDAGISLWWLTLLIPVVTLTVLLYRKNRRKGGADQ